MFHIFDVIEARRVKGNYHTNTSNYRQDTELNTGGGSKYTSLGLGIHYHKPPFRKPSTNPKLFQYSHPGSVTLLTRTNSFQWGLERETKRERGEIHSCVTLPATGLTFVLREGPLVNITVEPEPFLTLFYLKTINSVG